MLLDQVEISGFKSIAHIQRLHIGSPTVLAGHNDAGKSAVLDAIRYLFGAYELTDQDATLLHIDPSSPGLTPASTSEVSVVGSFMLSEIESDELGVDRQIRIRRTSSSGLGYEASVPEEADLRNYRLETNALLSMRIARLGLTPKGTRKPELLETLDEAAAMAAHALSWIPLPAAMKARLPRVEVFSASSVSEPEKAIRDSLHIAYQTVLASDTFTGRISKIETKIEEKLRVEAEALRSHIAARCGDLGELHIKPTVSLRGNLAGASVSITNPIGDQVGLTESGTGRGRRIAFAVWEHTTARLSQADQDLVLLYDEPDTHLDYLKQRDFMSLVLEQASLEHVRIVMASHSMNLIDGVDIADVVHLRLGPDLRTSAVELVDDSAVGSHLGAIAASLGLRNTVLLHERLFVGVEGATEASALPVLFKKAMDRHLESFGIAIWPCDNHEGALKFARYLQEHDRNVAFLVDADARYVKGVFSDDNLRKVGLDPDSQCVYVGDPNELEDTFADSVWARVANEIWTPDDGVPWQDSDFADLRGAGKFSQAVLDVLRERSQFGPSGKPEMVSRLAIAISKEEIPEVLLDRFDLLINRAN